MRGKRRLHPSARSKSRITPAHAGKTHDDTLRHVTPPDHPRACGENEEGNILQISMHGSPPRMRGKLAVLRYMPCHRRITPAHAGKTFPLLTGSCRPSDHPRACGENTTLTGSPPSGSGSPPRMRGKPKRPHRSRRYPRITPAHAGKTTHATPPKPRRTDHPRACGENPRLIGLQRADDGSPPRMRGKQRKGAQQDASRRITPAHAGKTARMADLAARTADHPRACGENRFARRASLSPPGSPPRMRGKRKVD